MYTPLVVGALTLRRQRCTARADRSARRACGARRHLCCSPPLTGVVGTGFHVYNVDKRPGGLSWLNLFYGAPLGAPVALLLSGLLGTVAERVRDSEPRPTPDIFGLPAGRALAALARGRACSARSARPALLHFRGAFHNPAMFAAGHRAAGRRGAAGARRRPARRDAPLARRGWWLRLTALLGFARRRLPRLRRRAQHGRLAQLERRTS